jgi:hypothetical protein
MWLSNSDLVGRRTSNFEFEFQHEDSFFDSGLCDFTSRIRQMLG